MCLIRAEWHLGTLTGNIWSFNKIHLGYDHARLHVKVKFIIQRQSTLYRATVVLDFTSRNVSRNLRARFHINILTETIVTKTARHCLINEKDWRPATWIISGPNQRTGLSDRITKWHVNKAKNDTNSQYFGKDCWLQIGRPYSNPRLTWFALFNAWQDTTVFIVTPQMLLFYRDSSSP